MIYGSYHTARDQVFIVTVEDGRVYAEAARGNRACLMMHHNESLGDFISEADLPNADGLYRFDCTITDTEDWTDYGREYALMIDGTFRAYEPGTDDAIRDLYAAWQDGYSAACKEFDKVSEQDGATVQEFCPGIDKG